MRGTSDVLYVGYRTTTSPVTEAALPGVAPAGAEAYELLTINGVVSPVVLSADAGGLTFFQLCT